MKSISTILVIVLLIIIIVGIVALSYTFFTSLFTTTTGAAQNTTIHQVEQLRTQVRIVSTVTNGVVVRNTGLNDVTELDVMVNEKIVDHTLEPPVIGPDEVGTVKILDYIKEDDEVEIMTGLGTVSVESPNPCDEAVLCLDFDENSGDTVYDKSDYSNDGTIIDNEGDQWTVGKYGSALNFDGVDDYVDLGSNAIVSNQAKFTVSLWFKTTSSNWENMYGEGNTGSGVDYSLVCTSASKLWGCVFGGSVYSCLESVQSVDDGEWHHVAYVKRASNDYELYLDGASVDTDTTDVSTPTIDNVRIGSINIGGTDDFFNGAIDSVRIYNKVLTPNEILILKKK